MTDTITLTALPPRLAGLREDAPLSTFAIALFLMAHVPLALLMYRIHTLATLHALATFAVGAFWALQPGKPERVAYAGAYIAGSEVLWRMTSASIFWEFGKYAVCAVFMLAMLRLPKFRRHDLSLIYFALLVPSSVLVLMENELNYARQEISFNLSGPFALMISIWFFSNIKLTLGQLRRVFIALMGPATAIAVITISSTYLSGNIRFGRNSNFASSGGFGPNQVSSILGLAALFAFLYLMQDLKAKTSLKLLLAGAMIVFTVQTAMTFSRGGLYLAGAAGVLAAFFLIKEPRQRARFMVMIVIAVLLVKFIILPVLDTFTTGALSARLTETNLTNRDRLMRADLRIFVEHPIFGVGPGGSREERQTLAGVSIAHTEFTRLLSDHGLLGLLALVPLLLTCLERFNRARTPAARALVASCMAWTLLYMVINGMRLVAPSLLFGLACINLAAGKRYFLLVETAEEFQTAPSGPRLD